MHNVHVAMQVEGVPQGQRKVSIGPIGCEHQLEEILSIVNPTSSGFIGHSMKEVQDETVHAGREGFLKGKQVIKW